MTQEDLDVLAGFGAVWERVSGERIDAPNASGVTWEELLQGIYDHWQGCASLGSRAVGVHRTRLLGLAGMARALFRRLQTEYYLETGDVFAAAVVCDFASYTPYNLRKLCKNAVKLAELLQKAEADGCLPVGETKNHIVDHEKVIKSLLADCLQ